MAQLNTILSVQLLTTTGTSSEVRSKDPVRAYVLVEVMSLGSMATLMLYLIVHTQSGIVNMQPSVLGRPADEADNLCVEVDCVLLLGLGKS